MLERLAKKIGYGKFKAYITTNDMSRMSEFLHKTKMRIKVYRDQKAVMDNMITGVPVTIVTMTDGRKLRFDGYSESFTENVAKPELSGTLEQFNFGIGQQPAAGLPQVSGSSCPTSR